MSTRAITISILFSSFAWSGSSPVCVQNHDQGNLSAGLCDGYIDHDFLVQNETYAIWVSSMVQGEFESFISQIAIRQSPECQISIFKNICSNYFPKCRNTTKFGAKLLNTTHLFRSQSCTDIRVIEKCGNMVECGNFEIERSTKTLIELLPWTTDECNLSFLDYLGNLRTPDSPLSRNMTPVHSRAIQCENFKASCKNILDLIDDGPLFNLNCLLNSSSSTMWIDSNSALTVKHNHSSNSIHVDESGLVKQFKGIAPSCPHGFVVPQEPSNPYVHWVDDSSCAFSCIYPVYTRTRWQQLVTMTTVTSCIGFVMVSAMMVVWLRDKERRKQHLILFFAATSGMVSLALAVGGIMASVSFENAFCRDNAVGLSHADGFTFCALQSFMVEYFSVAGCVAWMVQCFDLHLKLVWHWRHTGRYWKLHVFIVFGLPLCPTFYLLGTKGYGFTEYVPWCIANSGIRAFYNLDFYVFYIPSIIATVLGIIPMALTVIKLSKTRQIGVFGQGEGQGQGEAVGERELSVRRVVSSSVSIALSGKDARVSSLDLSKIRLMRTPIVFSCVYLVVLLILIVRRSISLSQTNFDITALDTWASCVMKNFAFQSMNSTIPPSPMSAGGTAGEVQYFQTCGGEEPFASPLLEPAIFVATSQSILVAMIFLPSVKWKWPWQVLDTNKTRQVVPAQPQPDVVLHRTLPVMTMSTGQQDFKNVVPV